MKIVDKTPYRSEQTGEIDILGRIQGTLKYGMTWYDRLKAQDVVIGIMEKQLGNSYNLLRNVTLPNTEITLPLVLIGPPGIYLINVLHERGVFIARDDEWGAMVGDRLVPARINHISRTVTFGRVLQVYLDRQGFKGTIMVESILLSSDPGMHIESTRPAVRIVMSDALERFAASMNQARAVLNPQIANDLVQAILVGRAQKPAASQPSPGQDQEAANAASFDVYTPQGSQGESAFSSDPLEFSFDDGQSAEPTAPGTAAPGNMADSSATAQPAAAPRRASPRPAKKNKGPLGLTTNQLAILGGIMLCWICAMAGFIIFISMSQ